ncbi:MAG: hypothetical protein LBT68_07895, partial [Spirochaetales bacterium]|nr:hypothetical protein [Spirochaetales bacterium]
TQESLSLFSAGTARGSWKEFLTAYRKEIASLPLPENPVIPNIQTLSKDEKIAWTTLLPVSAACFKAGGRESAQRLLKLSRAWAVETIDRFLE